MNFRRVKLGTEMSLPLPVEPVPLSRVLAVISAESAEMALTIAELQTALKGRGVAMLLLLFTLPFCFIPIPGLSIPFGIAVLLMGIRIAFAQKPWLPKFILQRSLSPSRLSKLLRMGMRFARIMEKVVKPRLRFLHHWPGAMNLIGIGISLCGLLLLLPLPIPFSNILPAWGVVFLAAGMMERDGLMVLIGHFLTLIAWAFVGFAWFFGAKGAGKLFDLFSG